MSRTLLLVESDSALRDELTCFVRGLGMEVIAVDGLAHAQACLDAGQAPSVVLAALRLPDGPGSQLLQAIQHFATPPAVIFMTANDRIEDAIESLRYGSADFLCKPFEMQVLADALERARKPDNPTLPPPPDFKADEPTNQEAILRWRRRFAPDMLGSHPSMLRVFKVLERVADTGCTVLVTGESGTGKELVARALHAASPRRKAPFIAVN
ncbi:MAG: sigma-54-dependent transcriptional regulator, partial [Polyangiales bacterium]